MPVDRLEECLGRRDHDIVERWHIEGAVAADAEVDSACLDERLDPWLDQAGRGRRSGNGEVFGQALALRQVEDRESLEKGDGLGVLARLAGAPLFVIGDETVGVDDGDAMLAPADMAAEREGLAEGQPGLAGEAVLDDGAPEDQHVDAGILPAGRGVLRHGERRLGRCRSPGLDPGKPAGFQLGEDPAGDFIIEARPLGAGTGARIVSGHRGSPRRAPEASPPALNPSRKTRPALSLLGALRGLPAEGVGRDGRLGRRGRLSPPPISRSRLW